MSEQLPPVEPTQTEEQTPANQPDNDTLAGDNPPTQDASEGHSEQETDAGIPDDNRVTGSADESAGPPTEPEPAAAQPAAAAAPAIRLHEHYKDIPLPEVDTSLDGPKKTIAVKVSPGVHAAWHIFHKQFNFSYHAFDELWIRAAENSQPGPPPEPQVEIREVEKEVEVIKTVEKEIPIELGPNQVITELTPGRVIIDLDPETANLVRKLRPYMRKDKFIDADDNAGALNQIVNRVLQNYLRSKYDHIVNAIRKSR